jgi:hypothetical protein
MLVSELISWCNNMYEPDEDTDFETSDNRWILFFNECLSTIRPFTNINTESTTDLVDGTTSYSLPSDLEVLHEIYICDDTTVDNPVYSEMYRVKEESVLAYNQYILWNNSIKIQDPEKNVTDGLKFYYYKNASDISATTETIEIDDPYLLGYYALSRIELSDRQTDDYAIHKSEYEDRLYSLASKAGYDITEMERGW